MNLHPAVTPDEPRQAGTPRILVSLPDPEFDAFFPQETLDALGELGRIVCAPPAELQDFRGYEATMGDVGIAVTGWGFPRFDAGHLAAAPNLRCVLHAASSVHFLVSEDFWAAGIPISQAGAAMAPAVAEMSLTFTLSLLRRVQRLDGSLRGGAAWETARTIRRAREIAGARIGVVGASRTGRRYVEMCTALGAEVSIYDPYIPSNDPLAARSVGLDELFSGSDVVAIHAPDTPQTRGMVGRAQLALLPAGGMFVNTARSSIVDMDALFEEVSSGRIDAALDVFDQEPLPAADRWRSLPNALLTPHIAGATAESRRRAGWIVVEELKRFLAGEPLAHAVTRAGLERMG